MEQTTNNLSVVSREVAAAINPFISDSGFSDTASNCRDAVEDLGYLVQQAMDGNATQLKGFYLLTRAIASALDYEVYADGVSVE